MQREDNEARIVPEGSKPPWQTPKLSRLRAGEAEVGFVPNVDDGPGGSKS